MDLSVSEIEKAIHQFYFVPAEQAKAHEWLTVIQVRPEAWNYCWDLIQTHKPQEVQFFGANTLHVKISKYWSELSVEQYPELKDKLIQQFVAYIPLAPNIILTRLCINFSCFILRTISDHWSTAIVDVINTFRVENLSHIVPEKCTVVLLQLLTILPEEFQTMVFANSIRTTIRFKLESNVVSVLSVIQETLTKSNNVTLNLEALKCLRSWVSFGIPIPNCTELLDLVVLNFIPHKELNEVAVDVLIQVITHPEIHKYPSSLLKILDGILQLDNILLLALQTKDLDVCLSMYNLYVSYGENHSQFLINEFLKSDKTKENFFKLIQIILSCSAASGQYPVEETFSSLAFPFWYNLQDDILSADKESLNIYMTNFLTIFESLVDIMLQKLMAPSKNGASWSSDELEQFRCYRIDISDTLMYCYNILRARMLERLLTHLNGIISRAENNEDVYQPLEACLFAVQAIAESIDQDENVYTPQFFTAIAKIPFNNNGDIIAAALTAVGAFSEWINCNPDVLAQVVPLMTSGIYHPVAAVSATHALKNICSNCQTNLKPFATDILMACGDMFSKRALKTPEQMRLMSCVGHVASLLPFDNVMTYLNSLLMPIFQEIQQSLEEPQLTLQIQLQLMSHISVLSTLFHTLNNKLPECNSDDGSGDSDVMNNPNDPTRYQQMVTSPIMPQPVIVLLKPFLPLLRCLVAKLSNSVPIVSGVCDLLKRTLTNLHDEISPVLEPVLELLHVIYNTSANLLVLDVVKLIALLFYDNTEKRLLVQRTLIYIVSETISISQAGGLSEVSDVAESFCQLLSQLFKKQPSYLIDENIDLLLLFQYGTAILAIPEVPAVKAASSFLVSFINQSRDYPSMLMVVNNYGDSVIMQILSCIGGNSPRGVMDCLTDVLFAMIKKYFDNSCRWLHIAISEENFPSPQISKEQKEQYIKRIIKEHSNKRKLQEIVKTFKLACRGLIGTEYANQVLPSL